VAVKVSVLDANGRGATAPAIEVLPMSGGTVSAPVNLGNGEFAQPDEIGLNRQALTFAGIDGLGKAGLYLVVQEGADAVEIAAFKGHEDHFIGAARAGQEFGHRKARLGLFHGHHGAGRVRAFGDMVGDVAVKATFDDLKLLVGAGFGRIGRHGRFFEPFAGSENRAQFQDEKNGNPGKNQKLQQGRIHFDLGTKLPKGLVVWA
jgi:hypothetical protein